MFFIKIFEEMTNADWLIFTVTFLAYFFITLGVKVNKGEGQSFFSWALWIVLDIILFIPTYWKDGKAIFMIMPSILGSIFISYLMIRMKKMKWGKDEWLSIFLVLITMLIWWLSSNNNIVITFSVISQVIAGWPLTKESWTNPRPKYTLTGYLLFILGCIFLLTLENNVFKNFILEDHLFPIALGLQTIVDVVPLLIKSIKNY